MITLNHMQEVAVGMYLDWYFNPKKRKRPWFEISGAAGTGKTTVVNAIVRELGLTTQQIAYMAFVGKATLALRQNGLPAKTIHSSIYDLKKVKKYDEAGNHIIVEEFVKKPYLPPLLKQIVLDEGGMVGGKIGDDLLSYNIPLLVLGDLKQLPPVMSQRMFLMEPDVTLTEIMRQAKDSPIIYLSQLATHGLNIPYGVYGNNECIVIHKDELTEEHLIESDIVICETNKMRDIINHYMRDKIQHIHSNRITIGDKLVCRQNCWTRTIDDDITLVNGLIGYVEGVYMESKEADMLIDFRPEFSNQVFHKVPINHSYPFKSYEDRANTPIRFLNGVAFEFGNAITCHLSQGSQYDTVLVYVERYMLNSLYFRQWLYTAITRAKKKLILVI